MLVFWLVLKAYHVPVGAGAAMGSTNMWQMHMNEEGFNTPIKKASVPLCVSQLLSPNNNRIHFTYLYMKVLINSSFMLQCSSFIPECEDDLKPKVGMTFEGLKAVEEFYKSYAHQSGFGVRIGQQKKLENEVVRTKRYMCNRQGFKFEMVTRLMIHQRRGVRTQTQGAVVMHTSLSWRKQFTLY